MPCGSCAKAFFCLLMNQELSIKLIRELEKAPEAEPARALGELRGEPRLNSLLPQCAD